MVILLFSLYLQISIHITLDDNNYTSIPAKEFIQQSQLSQIDVFIQNLTTFANKGFPFAATRDVFFVNMSDKQIQQANDIIRSQIQSFQLNETYSSYIPYKIIFKLIDIFVCKQTQKLTQLIQQLFPEQQIQQANQDMNKLYDWIDNGILRGEKCMKIINQFINSQTNDVISVIIRDQQIQIIYPMAIQMYMELLSFADEILQGATQIVNQTQICIRDRYDGFVGPVKCSTINLQCLSLLQRYTLLRTNLLSLKNLLYYKDKPLVINVSDKLCENIEYIAAISVCSASNCSLQYINCNDQIKSSEIAQLCYIISDSYRVFTMINVEKLSKAAQFWLSKCYPKRNENNLQKSEIYQGFQQIKDVMSDSQCINISGQLVLIQRISAHQNKCNCCCKNVFCDKENQKQIKQQNQLDILNLLTQDVIQIDLDCSLGGCYYTCDTEEEYIKTIQSINNYTIDVLKTLFKLSRLTFHLVQINNPSNQLLLDQMMLESDCSIQLTENIDITGFKITLHDANDYTTCIFYDKEIDNVISLYYQTFINQNLHNQHIRIAVIDNQYNFFIDNRIITPYTQLNEIPIPIDLQMPLITLLMTTNPSLCYESSNLLQILKNPMLKLDLSNKQTLQIMQKINDLIPFKENNSLKEFINICNICGYYYLDKFITQGINIFLKQKQTKTSKIMTQMLIELFESIQQEDFSIVKFVISISNLYKFFDKSLITKENCNIEGKLGKQVIYSLNDINVYEYIFNKQQIESFDIYKIFNIKFEEELNQIQINNIVYITITKGMYKLLVNNISTKMSSQKQSCIYNINEKRMYPLKQNATGVEIVTQSCAQISEQYLCFCEPQDLIFINTINQEVQNSQQFIESTQQIQQCFYIFLPNIVSLIQKNKQSQISRLNELQQQIISYANQIQNWWSGNDYSNIIQKQCLKMQYKENINIQINKLIKQHQISYQQAIIQQIEQIFTEYSNIQIYLNKQVYDLINQVFSTSNDQDQITHTQKLQCLLKITMIYAQYVSAFILLGLSDQKKAEMMVEIADAYLQMLNYLYNQENQYLVNVTNSIILIHLLQQDQLKQILNVQALDFIGLEQLQMLEYNDITTALLTALLLIWCNYQCVFTTLEQIDFFTTFFSCKVKKFIISTENIINQEIIQQNKIEENVYYGELYENYQYLLPKVNSSYQVVFGCLNSNCDLDQNQFKQIQEQLNDNQILLQKINFEAFQKSILQENYEQFKEQPICLNLLSKKFLNENKIITNEDLHYIQLEQGEEFQDKLTYISKHVSNNITVADYYQILQILQKGQQNKIQISNRQQSIVQKIKTQTLLNMTKQYKQRLQRNVTWGDVIDNAINNSGQDKEIVIQIILRLLNQDIHHINIYYQYEIDDINHQQQVLSQEQVSSILSKMINNIVKIKSIDYLDIIKLLQYSQCFVTQQLSNQYSRIFIENKIKLLIFQKNNQYTGQQLVDDLLIRLNQQNSWQYVNKLSQNNDIENIVYKLERDYISYQDILTIYSQIQTQNYKKIIIILYVNNIQLSIEQKLNLIDKINIYNIKNVQINMKKIQDKQQQDQIIFWQDTDYKKWKLLQMTTQNVFAEDDQQKLRYSKLNSSLNSSSLNQVQKDLLVEKIQQLNLGSDNLEEQLSKLFTLPFIAFYQKVITSSSSLELQQFDKAVEQYSGTQYLLNNDIYNLQKIIQLNYQQTKNITFKWLQYDYLIVEYPEFQQQLPQIQGHIHKWLTAYYNNVQRNQQQQQQQKRKIDQYKNQLPVSSTLQMPHLFPDTTIAMSLSLILSQLQNTNSLWNDLKQSLTQQYQPTDDVFFKVFLFIYSNIGKIAQSSIISTFVVQSQDAQFEKQKFYMFSDMYLNILLKQIRKQQGQSQTSEIIQISQIDYLIFYFQNTKLCNMIAQTIHNMYKSDLQHYVVKYLQEQADQLTPNQFYDSLSKQLLSFASDCFEKNLSYCVFFIRFALMNCSEQQIKQEKTKYWLTLTYYYLCYQNQQGIELKQTCQQQKDMKLINIFKQLINKPIQSVILDILAIPYIQQNKYVVQQVLRHYFLMETFNDNEDLAVKELIFCFEQYNIDHQLIVQLFQQKHQRIQIIDTESMLNPQIIKQLKINSMNLLNSILQLYKQYLDEQFNKNILNSTNEVQLAFIKLQLSLRIKKWQFNYDLQQLNQYQPRGSEYITDITIIKQCNAFTDQLIGYYLAKLFTNKFDFLQLKQLIKLNDSLQYQFYGSLQQLYSRDIVNMMIQRSEQIQQIFPQIYSTAKQASLNAECDKLPQFSISHLFNSKLYYEQRVNRQWTSYTQLSQLIQEFIINDQKSEIPDSIKKLLQNSNNQTYIQKNIQRIQVIKDVYMNQNIQPMIKSTLIATEQLLLEPGAQSIFYQLLADNHDECLGLYCPAHGFESRLGIVHFDCGTKDSKYAKMSPLEVQVRALSSIATRLTWILSYACIYLSLKINPVTMTTNKEKSIMSEPDLLEMPRDDYCFVVIENCFSVITQILCCYQYEALILYQQFIINFIKLIKQQDKNTILYMLRSAQQRDKVEDIIQQSVDMSMVSMQEVLKKNQQSNQIQLNPIIVQQKQQNQLNSQEIITTFLKAKIPIDIQTALANGVFNGIVVSKMLHYHKNKLSTTMTIQDAIDVCEEIQTIKNKFINFIEQYNISKHLLTIGNGCQDNQLPTISEDVCIGQLITFDADDQSQNLQDFAVMDQYIQAGKMYLQTLQLPYLSIYDELETIPIRKQSWLLI